MPSIVGTGDPLVRLKKGWAFTLRLRYDDIEGEVPGGILFNDPVYRTGLLIAGRLFPADPKK